MALASRNAGKPCKSVAVIGDGGLTAGLAYEALNHLGVSEADVLVILNDNEMSISPNVGAMSRYLTRLLAGSLYSSVRETGQRMLSTVPRVKKFAMRVEGQLKGMILPAGMLFEELGVQYFGPVGGHDVLGLLEVIEKMRDQTGPRLLHVITQKGMGYEPAEGDPVGYHAVPTFDPEIGVEKKGSSGGPTYTQVFGEWLCDQAAADPRLMAITPAMREGSGLVRFEKEHPDRYFDVGIAEQHSVAVARAWLAQARSRWWPSIRHSCSVDTTSWSMTSWFRNWTCCLPSTGPGWSETTGRPMSVLSTCLTCVACRAW